ncbi:PRC-barrel domain-containing protein [Aureimonas populi]|uniref:PRC-barrel domain-containing protein n=1 Tax=Aureimonas populi TaxID=1701758 RepID=A0ABW5CLY2_9HYPH|nr:PRC-barrel domain-containing protein [Aureimonas populi]
MKKTIYSALLATAMIPFAAGAQTATPETTPPATTGEATDPAMGTTPPATGTMDSDAPESGAPATDTGPMGEEAETTAPTGTAMGTTATADGPFVTVPPMGAWRTSDLEGKSVEDANGESIGSISDTLVDENGQVIAVLVGVGGFLGIGQKDVAVSMESLEFGPLDAASLPSAAAADTTAPAATMDTAAPAADTAAAPATPTVGDDNLPDRIVLNVTREELEAAPAYGEPEDMADDTDSGVPATTPAAPAQ